MIVPEITETTALGAAYLAGIGAGFWARDEVARDVARGGPLRAGDGGRASASA